jgi:membrane dipeptidase
LIGPEHVGIGGDFNGVDKTPKGLDDVSKYPNLFDKLAEEGHGYESWSRDDLKKLAGQNFIRVFKEVEKIRDEIKNITILEKLIPNEFIDQPEMRACRADIDFLKTGNFIDD